MPCLDRPPALGAWGLFANARVTLRERSNFTGVNAQPNPQAHSRSWDTNSGQYGVVARTAGFPNTPSCSS